MATATEMICINETSSKQAPCILRTHWNSIFPDIFCFIDSLIEYRNKVVNQSVMAKVKKTTYIHTLLLRSLLTDKPPSPRKVAWPRHLTGLRPLLFRIVVWVLLLPMETEKDNSIPILDTSVIRDSNGLLTTSVYRKPTHTDQYLAYDSHHPQSVKRGIVKCLYDRAKHLITKPSVISEEKKHLFFPLLFSNSGVGSFTSHKN